MTKLIDAQYCTADKLRIDRVRNIDAESALKMNFLPEDSVVFADFSRVDLLARLFRKFPKLAGQNGIRLRSEDPDFKNHLFHSLFSHDCGHQGAILNVIATSSELNSTPVQIREVSNSDCRGAQETNLVGMYFDPVTFYSYYAEENTIFRQTFGTRSGLDEYPVTAAEVEFASTYGTAGWSLMTDEVLGSSKFFKDSDGKIWLVRLATKSSSFGTSARLFVCDFEDPLSVFAPLEEMGSEIFIAAQKTPVAFVVMDSIGTSFVVSKDRRSGKHTSDFIAVNGLKPSYASFIGSLTRSFDSYIHLNDAYMTFNVNDSGYILTRSWDRHLMASPNVCMETDGQPVLFWTDGGQSAFAVYSSATVSAQVDGHTNICQYSGDLSHLGKKVEDYPDHSELFQKGAVNMNRMISWDQGDSVLETFITGDPQSVPITYMDIEVQRKIYVYLNPDPCYGFGYDTRIYYTGQGVPSSAFVFKSTPLSSVKGDYKLKNHEDRLSFLGGYKGAWSSIYCWPMPARSLALPSEDDGSVTLLYGRSADYGACTGRLNMYSAVVVPELLMQLMLRDELHLLNFVESMPDTGDRDHTIRLIRNEATFDAMIMDVETIAPDMVYRAAPLAEPSLDVTVAFADRSYVNSQSSQTLGNELNWPIYTGSFIGDAPEGD
jgi:hypothetical protein